jgi:RHS repeat-associated protein
MFLLFFSLIHSFCKRLNNKGNVGLYIDELLAFTNQDGKTYYVTTDRQFSVRAVVDSQGDIVEERNYDPFGKDMNGVAETSDLAYGFTGRRYDSESDLYYFRARYYSTDLGSFISRDKLNYVDGMNVYSGYFASRFNFDPTGLSDLTHLVDGHARALARQEAARKKRLEVLKQKFNAKGLTKAMEAIADDCMCKNCSIEDAKKDAQKIAQALERMFVQAHGQGSSQHGHNRGGFLCWDWSTMFNFAANTVASKCWQADVGTEFATDGSGTIHYFLVLSLKDGKKELTDNCYVIIDDDWSKDGWWRRKNLVEWADGNYDTIGVGDGRHTDPTTGRADNHTPPTLMSWETFDNLTYLEQFWRNDAEDIQPACWRQISEFE